MMAAKAVKARESKEKEVQQDLESVLELMDSIGNDSAVPRNIRGVLLDTMDRIQQSNEKEVAISAAVYSLDDILNDINMPSHTRTDLWTIISQLESLKEKLK